MKKIKFLFISAVILLVFNFVTINLYAQEENEQIVQDEEDELKQKEDIVKLIDEYLSEIESKLNDIDLKIENSKSRKSSTIIQQLDLTLIRHFLECHR